MNKNSIVKFPLLLFIGMVLGYCGGLQETQIQASQQITVGDTSNFISIGGMDQYVEIHGASTDLPLLLFLHGGPGMPATPLLKYYQKELSNDFIVVSWDQRGCGRSAKSNPRPSDMTLEQHIQDAHELTTYLKEHFGKESLCLVGHSWGSVLGVELAQRYPEDYLAYVGVGQMVNTARGELIGREVMVTRALARDDTSTIKTLQSIHYSLEDGYSSGLQGFLGHRRLLWMNRMADYDPSAMMIAIKAAGEGYSSNITDWMTASMYAQNAMFDEIMSVDFSHVTKFQIPIYFLAGRHDYNTPSQLTAEFYANISAPQKGLYWFENSGHSPPWEEPEAFRVRLREILAKVDGDGAPAVYQSRTHGSLPQNLDEIIQTLMKEWGVPGLSLAIVSDGETLLTKGYGLTQIGMTHAVDEKTIFGIASTTKAFTAAALGMLVDDGLLDWDDPIAKHLPGFSLVDADLTRRLTIRDILSHRSGYDRHDGLWHAFGYERSEMLERLGRLEPSWGLRERFGYQNLMYLLAGSIIETVSGMTWDQFIEKRMFDPLDMKRSGTRFGDLTVTENVSSPHIRGRDGTITQIPWRNADNIGPAGSIHSSAEDLAKWMKLLLAKGRQNDMQLLSAETVEEMQNPQIIVRPEDDFIATFLSPGNLDVSYGLGWYLHDYHGKRIVEHPGGTDGMSPIITLVPSEGLGIAILSNISMPSGAHIALRGEILDALLNVEGTDWPEAERLAFQQFGERISAGFSKGKPSPPTLSLSGYAGRYSNQAYGQVRILSSETGLTIRFGEQGVHCRLIPLRGDVFLVLWDSPLFPPALATFKINPDATIHNLLIEGMGSFEPN